MDTEKKESRRTALGGCLLVVAAAGSGVLLNRSCVQPALKERSARRKARQEIQKHIEISEAETSDAVLDRCQDLAVFFQRAEKGIPAFAKEMLGWTGKWKLIWEKATFWDKKDRHKNHVKKSFEEHVFRAEDLAKAIHTAVEDFVARDGEAINNRLLTRIRDDVSLAEIGYDPDTDEFEEAAKNSFKKALKASVTAEFQDLGVDSGSFVLSLIGGVIAGKVLVRVAVAVATRLGVTATVLTAGASGAAFSFGLTLIAAIIVDLVLGWIINIFWDPQGKLEEQLTGELNSLKELVIYGDNQTTGVKDQLETLARLLQESRTKAIDSVIAPYT